MAFSVAPCSPLEAVSLSSGSGGGGGGASGGKEAEEKVSSDESRCRPPSQRNFSGGSTAPVGETRSDFLHVSRRSDGGFSPLAQPLGSWDLFAGINYRGCAQTAFPASLIHHINNLQADFRTGGIDHRKALWSGTYEQLKCGCGPHVFNAIKGDDATANVMTGLSCFCIPVFTDNDRQPPLSFTFIVSSFPGMTSKKSQH